MSAGLAAAPPARRDPAWSGRLAMAIAGALVLWPLLVATEFTPWTMLDAHSLRVTGRFLGEFYPPALSAEFLELVAHATGRTIAIATCGVALALVLAIPLSLVSTAALSVSRLSGRMAPVPFAVRLCTRVLMVGLRTVPELVWALVLVRVVGLGPTSGVLAIALTYGGLLGKVYGEILESADAHAARSLLVNGSGRLAAFLHGLLPNASAELCSYTLYRWECAIRSSVILGFVGAGGLGQMMDTSVKMLAGNEVATLLLVFVGLVALADLASAAARRALRED